MGVDAVNTKHGRREPSEDTVAEEDASRVADAGDPAAADEATRADAGATGAPESAADYKDRWMRSVADLQNYRRRTQRELDETRRVAEERVMHEMLSALDDLERALGAARDAGAPESWTQGVQLVVNRMSEYLARQGITVLDPMGERFDPEFHDAMLEVESDALAPGHVAQVAQRGYRRGDRVLRPARVVVTRGSAESEG
jgi:molecular chaperone GrpE